MSFGQKYDADIPAGHAFEEKRDMMPRDRRLRQHGFRIEKRPNNGPAVWSRRGQTFTESEAHCICAEEEKAKENG